MLDYSDKREGEMSAWKGGKNLKLKFLRGCCSANVI